MNKERLLELAGVKKAIGKTNSILTEEIDAKSFVRSLPLYRDLMKDQRAKPEALRTAVQFVKDFEGQPVNDRAKKWIQDELANIAHSHNPRGAMLSNDPEDIPDYPDSPPEPELSPEEHAKRAEAEKIEKAEAERKEGDRLRKIHMQQKENLEK